MGTKANSEDPIEMQHSGAFHQGLHCCIREKQIKKYHNRFTCVSLKTNVKMSFRILVVSIYMGQSTRVQNG